MRSFKSAEAVRLNRLVSSRRLFGDGLAEYITCSWPSPYLQSTFEKSPQINMAIYIIVQAA